MPSIRRTFTISKDLSEKLNRQGEKEDRAYSRIVSQALREYFDRYNKRMVFKINRGN